MTIWRNWAGTASAHPQLVAEPGSVDEVVAQVVAAGQHGHTVRMIGSGHSFTDTAAANGVMLRPGRLSAVREVDVPGNTITVESGMNLATLCEVLDEHGLALPNMGDIRVQTVAGAFQTGSHGTGRASGAYAGTVRALELVTGDGQVVTVSPTSDPELFETAKVGLGAFGVVTALTIAVEPSFRLHAYEHPATFDETVASFDKWTAEHDHVEFFWFPHTQGCLVKRNDRTDAPPEPVGKLKAWWDDEFLANTVFKALCRLGRAAPGYVPTINKVAARSLSERSYTDVSWRVFTSGRHVKFVEMEYALPREALLPVLREVKDLLDNGPWRVTFPVEVRSVPADDAWLSTSHGRDTGYIAVHAFQHTDYDWFQPVESIMRAHDGRPHWGKLHTRTAADLAPTYERWADIQGVRERVDPERRFANAYTQRVLGP